MRNDKPKPAGKPAHRRPDRDKHHGDEGPLRLFGIHAVEAALANPGRAVLRLLLTDNAEHRLAPSIAARKARHERVSPRDLDRLLGPDTVHQGALLETDALAEPSLADLAALATSPGAGPLIVLDQVTDPHNVGAILRSAAAFGATGLVMTRRHSPPLADALAKAASGALEVVPVALVTNLARSLEELAEHGVRRLGLDGEAPALVDEADLGGPLALVLGAEGRGLRRLTRDLCDGLVRIATPGPLASLNVSNAAAVALYLVQMRRRL
jgi:23S rRNA (guanosine2251-2'-O)-methyltransferase